jgi:hypothetical protein
MNLSENFSNSFSYAKKLLIDGGRLIILIILDLIPIVNWIVVGYAAQVLQEAPSSEAPPRLENYGKLFVDGAKVSVAMLIYMIVPLGLIFAGAGSLFAGSVLGELSAGLVLGGLGVILFFAGILFAFVFLILLGVGIAHMVKTGKFGKAFAFGEILRIIRGIGWGKYLGWAVLTLVFVSVIGWLTGLVPYVGWLLSAIISPFLSVFIFRSLGDLYNDGVPSDLKSANVSAVGTVGITCSSCGTPMQPYHKFCPACGSPAPIVEAEIKYCISCGGRMESGAVICGSCGAKQS